MRGAGSREMDAGKAMFFSQNFFYLFVRLGGEGSAAMMNLYCLLQ
jgi:hypothetical protein